MRTAFSLIGAAALLGLGLSSAAMAQDNPGRSQVGQACAADFQKLCPDAKGPDRRKCLQDNQAKLSDGCKSAMAAMQQQQQGGAAPK